MRWFGKIQGLWKSVEVWISLFCLAAAFLVLGLYARGGPLSTDSLYYMDASLNNLKDPFILNRYAHVFLQKLFLEAFPTPLQGAQFYWAFLVSGILFFTYWSARLIEPDSTVFHGLLAVLLLAAIPAIGHYSGTPLVDLTVALFVIATVLVYLLSMRRDHRNRWLLMGLGLLIVIGFKIKETTLINLMLLIALGVGKISKKGWCFKWVGVGAGIGILLILVLNGFILKDALFGFRPSDWALFFTRYLKVTLGAPQLPGSDTWLSSFWLASTLVPFLLYLVSGIFKSGSIQAEHKVIWLMPLVLILVTQVSIGNQFGYEERFALPGMPLVCYLAPQFLSLHFPEQSSSRRKPFFILIFTLGGMIALRFLLRWIVPAFGGDLGVFIDQVFTPALVILLLGIIFWKQPINISWSMAVWGLIATLAISPLVINLRLFFLVRTNYQRMQTLVEPLYDYPQVFELHPGESSLISPNIWKDGSLTDLIKQPAEISSLANVVFKTDTLPTQFFYSSLDTSYLASLQEEKPNLALISEADYHALVAAPGESEWLQGTYDIQQNLDMQLVLLSRIP